VEKVILVVHLLLALAMVGVILLQKSEGGALGMGGGGGGGGGMGGFLSGRAAGDLLTRTTAILAACFFATSVTLAIMAGGARESISILDQVPVDAVSPVAPAQSGDPSAPLAK
jgi:preprotein translocase subunit SecG